MPSAPRNELPGHHLRYAILLMLASFVIFAALTALPRFARDTSSSLHESPILGTWQLLSTADGAVGKTVPHTPTYIGFVIENGSGILRRYSDGMGTSTLLSFDRWRMIGSSLETTDFWDDMFADATNYTVSQTENSLTLTRMTNGAPTAIETYRRVRDAAGENAIQLARPPAENADVCAHIFDEGVDASELLPIVCDHDLGHGIIAHVELSATGTLAISVDGGPRFSTDGGEGLEHGFADVSGPFYKEGSISFTDVTYDGYSDLVLLSSAGAYNFSYDYYAFNPQTKTFDANPIVSATNPGLDEKTRTIESFDKGRGTGDLYTDEFFHFENGAYVLTKRITQDSGNLDAENATYIRTTEELKNGKLVVTSKKTIPVDQIMSQ